MTAVWSTPQRIYDALHREFGFNLDVCCDPENAKCTYFVSLDGLNENWGDARCWLNPPYGKEIGKWMEKAYVSAKNGALVVALIPGRTNSPWWHDYVMKASEVRFVRRKLAYDLNGTKGKGVPAFGSVIAIWGLLNKRLGAAKMRGGGHKDLAATAAAHFTDSRSYVRLDGRRFLFGDDIEQLRRQVFERDGFTCTGEVEGERCGRIVDWDTGQMHHVQSRGKRGDDSMSNCVTLCDPCHKKLHLQPHLRWIWFIGRTA